MLKSSDLNGKWQSQKSEPIENQNGTVLYIRREASFSDDNWEIMIRTFLDENCKHSLFNVRATGTYNLDNESKDVPGATCVDFHNTARYVTANNEPIVEMLNHATILSRGWELEVEQDVSENGCLLVPSVADCPVEYDIIKKDENGLYFGDYTPDQEEELQKLVGKNVSNSETSHGTCSPNIRPKQLIKHPLVKINSN
ncbi:hypothetical protein [Methanobacterium paludis]|uniref:APCDD1 domain-containing protein n=1 Tax=Methanobacterium paludis (strain DSM 25820 / JCM 18151 / SWAN1) TaxID=868131 RepID=F6D460_METPW|nr:hypothetical protein [Methanobacterium paludis]AEG17482.1 hypothetical protein MSWAN_0442 [Methanobacterium paludis]